jgi:hypothetical protein
MFLLLGIGSWVAQADVIDLTTVGAQGCDPSATGVGMFCVQQISPKATGTGVINSFLRVDGNNNPTESGYNDNVVTPLDDVGGHTFDVLLSDVPIVTFNGMQYRQFFLDINQTHDNPLLSLNQVQIFVGTVDATLATMGGTPCDSKEGTGTDPSCTSTTSPDITLSGETQVFAINGPGAFDDSSTGSSHSILLNYALNSGSGSGDMFLYVPIADFSGVPDSDFVTLYSQFGAPPGTAGQNDGYEEWATVKGGPTSVPDGGMTLVLLGGALVAVEGLRRRFRV